MRKTADSTVLDNTNRIFSYIVKHPGCYLRKIRSDLGISMGTTQYHLNELIKSGKITAVRGGLRKFYFVNGIFRGIDPSKILQIMSQDTARKILLLIIVNTNITQSDLLKSLGISYASVHWHIKRLVEFELVSEIKSGKYKKYKLCSDSEILIEILKNYNPGIFDIFSNRLTNVLFTLSEGATNDGE